MRKIHLIGMPISSLAGLIVSYYRHELICLFLFGGYGLIFTFFPLNNEPKWRYAGLFLLFAAAFVTYVFLTHTGK